MARALALLALLPAAALAGEAARGPAPISAIVIPMDPPSEALQLRLETYMNESLQEFAQFKLRRSDDLFGLPTDEDAQAALKRAETGYAESKEAFGGRHYDDAELKLRNTIKEFNRAVPALKTCGHLCDAIAMYAACLYMRGESEEAKLQLLDLISLAPTKALDSKVYPADFVALKRQVTDSRNAALRGNVLVKSKPAGARVFVNGEFQGFTPMTLPVLPIGKALVRLERPGFQQAALLVDVTPEDSEVTQALVPSSTYSTFDDLLEKLATEAMKDKGGNTMIKVAGTLRLEKAIIAVTQEVPNSSSTQIHLTLYDLKSGRRMGVRKATVQGDEYGQLKGEIGRMVNALVNNAEAPVERVVQSSDPLDRKAGMEEWNQEDRGGRTGTKERKRKGGDPLDSVDGTDSW